MTWLLAITAHVIYYTLFVSKYWGNVQTLCDNVSNAQRRGDGGSSGMLVGTTSEIIIAPPSSGVVFGRAAASTAASDPTATSDLHTSQTYSLGYLTPAQNKATPAPSTSIASCNCLPTCGARDERCRASQCPQPSREGYAFCTLTSFVTLLY